MTDLDGFIGADGRVDVRNPFKDLDPAGQPRQCVHGCHHPGTAYSIPHSCDGCWCEAESDLRNYGWAHVNR